MAEPPDSVAAEALFAKAYTLGALGHPAEELAVYDDLLARFGSATELPLREQVARGLFNKGFRLGALGRSEDQVAALEDLLARFGFAEEPAMTDLVGHALDSLTLLAFNAVGGG